LPPPHQRIADSAVLLPGPSSQLGYHHQLPYVFSFNAKNATSLMENQRQKPIIKDKMLVSSVESL